jgi:cyclohexyl-isocyanide hydratase
MKHNQNTQELVKTDAKINLGIPLYPTFDSLDVLGPLQVFSYAPNISVSLIAATLDAVTSLEGVRILPDLTFDCFADPESANLDVLFVPGGADIVSPLQQGPLGQNEFLDFLVSQAQHAQLVCSVCTGALLLGAAGLLDGHVATTHWTQLGTLQLFPCTVAAGYPRYVYSGNRITGGGISSGIDEAFYIVSLLSGVEAAKECQLKMQYRPEPPFHTGDPADSDIWKHPLLPEQIMQQWGVSETREAYKAWLTSQSHAAAEA